MDSFDESMYMYEGGEANMEYYDEDPSTNHLIEYQSFMNVCHNCAVPIITKTLIPIAGFLAWALIYRLLYFRVTNWWRQIVSCICGVGMLYWSNLASFSHVAFLGISTYFLLELFIYLRIDYKGYIMAIYCFLYLLLCEFVEEDVIWRQISGTQMIIVMKTVSVAFDLDKRAISVPSAAHYFGYIYAVSSVLFGPWISYQEHCKLNVTMNLLTVLNILKYLTLSLICLTVSSCWGYWLIPDDYTDWLLVYRDALLFRNSHYFVSHLSKVISMAAGFDYSEVVHLTAMEFPRSLVQVVVHWNIPMHRWLKHYVFRPCQRMGKFVAILSVYIASAALHGFSAALALVLLSLGFYTYVEYMLRYKISQALNSCTLAAPCKENCGHLYPKRSFLAVSINLFFTGLAVLHLAYLGVIFEDISLMRATNPLTHTISTWADVGFISHILIFVQYFIYLLI